MLAYGSGFSGLVSADAAGAAERRFRGAAPRAISQSCGSRAGPEGAQIWARAGMSTPTPASLLSVLAASHLDARSRQGLADKREIQAALRWATRAINPTVSLLQREQHDTFSVFNYALDLISGQDEPIPETTWPVLIQHASPADLMNIGRAANTASRPKVAEQAWHRAEETGDSETAPMAALFLGAQLREQGDMEGAQAAYQRAIASGHKDAAPGATFEPWRPAQAARRPGGSEGRLSVRRRLRPSPGSRHGGSQAREAARRARRHARCPRRLPAGHRLRFRHSETRSRLQDPAG